LAEALGQLGSHAVALEPARKAVELLPGDIEAHNILGLHLNALGRPTDAEKCFRRALQIRPDLPGVHYSLGTVLCRQGRWDEAEASFRQAVAISPHYADAHHTLGGILKMRGRLNEAQACFQRALALSPDSVEVHCDLGNTFYEQGLLNEAQESYRRALKLKSDCADAFVGLGEVATAQGWFVEAEAFFARALAIDPLLCSAYAAMAHVRKMTSQDGAWLAGADTMIRRGVPPLEESFLRYAMGKYFNDLQDYDRAFQNYARANELSKIFGNRYDAEQQAFVFDQLIQAYPAEQVRRAHAGASDSTRPLFIVGMPRSGTSLIEQIIASHPAAFGGGELNFWGDVLKQHGAAVFAAQLDETLMRKIADACLSNLSRFSKDAMRVVDKMPVNFSILGLIHSVFPNARIIHVQRHPVDTCLSIYFQNFSAGYAYANDLANLAHYYGEYHRLMAHWRAVLPAGALLDVPYEALVDDQESWSRKIIEFVGLDWDDRCLKFHQTERSVATSSKWQVRQPIYKTSKERWRNYEKYAGPLLDLMKFGAAEN
jgi:tetratricopeptide (TPR) repeat protein